MNLGSILAITFAVALCSSGLDASALAEADVHAAIVASVRARMGASAIVSVDRLDVRGIGAAARLRAIPDAGSKVGGPMRFLLVDGASKDAVRRLGSADATVTVAVAHVRTRQTIARRQVLAASDLVVSLDEVGRVPLQRLPTLDEVVGASASRNLEAGTVMTRHNVDAVPLVKSGDSVVTIVRLGAIEGRGRAVAGGTAAMGETVRVVVNRRSLRGRVVGPGEVEIQR
jgi:flagella basal body P-ring formation protein FlgA